jgi:hypothetical protein
MARIAMTGQLVNLTRSAPAIAIFHLFYLVQTSPILNQIFSLPLLTFHHLHAILIPNESAGYPYNCVLETGYIILVIHISAQAQLTMISI